MREAPAVHRRHAVRVAALLAAIAGALPACTPAAAPVTVIEIAAAPPAPPPTPEEEKAASEERRAAEAKRAASLRGVGIRIVYTDHRERDAHTAGERLRRVGAKVLEFRTSDDGNGPHLGKLYVKPGHEEQAVVIMKMVADLEVLKTAVGDGFEESEPFSLWIAR